MNPKDFLIAAKENLQTYGWCQDTGRNRAGEMCLMRALNNDRSLDEIIENGFPAADTLRNILGNENLIYWNDSEGRTKEEVLELLDKGIATLEEE